jgi:type VI secretion system protein ImpG
MDPRLLQYYNRELQHLREMGAEFAREFPKIAGRIGLESFECADPYVERLLEGFAFLAARVQLKIDEEFPRFTQHLLEMVYPHYLAPTPSMAVMRLKPDPAAEGGMASGFRIPRGASLRSAIPRGEQTACEYRTAHDVTLWPLKILEAEYLASPSAVANLGVPALPGMKAGLRLRLAVTAGMKFNQLALDNLPVYLRGSGSLPVQVYEQLTANAMAVTVLPTSRPPAWREVIDKSPIRGLGFGDDDALLPYGPRSFQGYRLLHEYFAFPERFLFVEFKGLRRALQRCNEAEADLVVQLNRVHPALINALDAERFALFCTPTVNLIEKRADRIHLSQLDNEYHILPDRTRPLDFEVYAVEEVVGYGANQGEEQTFLPFYESSAGFRRRDTHTYYTLQRRKRYPFDEKNRQRSAKYIGSETYIALVDGAKAPYSSKLKQLGLKLLCTNRDLPLRIDKEGFYLQTGGPVQTVDCLSGPSIPHPSVAEGSTAWALINHLSLNYLSLTDNDARQGAAALRELCGLYCASYDESVRRQLDGIVSVSSKNVVRRIDAAGPIVFGRGLEISLRFDETAFEGGGAFLLGAALDRFFARYASINTFTETAVSTTTRGEIMRWPIRIGTRHTL